ncbi:GMC oxidoreductase [Paracoccus marcusii]|uniref:GMC oxidoreductase n=1 Tax=Paracoccus marcusii TaxID=59779 RepID=UPI0039C8B57F
MRSKSRGTIRLASGDPSVAPEIRFNYMSQPEDWEEFRACVRHTRRIFDAPAFKEYRGDEIQPGDAVQTDEQIDAFIREHAESAYHPCGTARMGAASDPDAVVDPELRVIGSRAACRGQLDLSAHHQRQPERPVDRDRRKGRRSHPGPPDAAHLTKKGPQRCGPSYAASASA